MFFPTINLFIPGVSPGSSINGFKQDHVRFLEASRPAIEAADGLGIHLYWSLFSSDGKCLRSSG